MQDINKNTMKCVLVLISFLSFFPVFALSLSPSSNTLNNRHKNTNISPFDVSRRDAASSFLSSGIGSTTAFLVIGGTHPANADSEEGYITTPRGLKYKVVTLASDPNSPTPKRAQKVKAKYTLYLNGFPEDTDKAVKIDSSKGFLGEKPFEFLAGVSQVIKGWDLSILEMRVGEARKLVIPSDLGYGSKGAGGKIPGGATLYFDVELADIGEMAKVGPDQIQWLEDNPL